MLMSSQKSHSFTGKYFSHIKENVDLDINVTLKVSKRKASWEVGKERETTTVWGKGRIGLRYWRRDTANMARERQIGE